MDNSYQDFEFPLCDEFLQGLENSVTAGYFPLQEPTLPTGLVSDFGFDGLDSNFSSNVYQPFAPETMMSNPPTEMNCLDSFSFASVQFEVSAPGSPLLGVPELELPMDSSDVCQSSLGVGSPASFSSELTPIPSPAMSQASLCENFGSVSMTFDESGSRKLSSASLMSRRPSSSSSSVGSLNMSHLGISTPHQPFGHLAVPQVILFERNVTTPSTKSSKVRASRKDRYKRECEYCGKSLSNTGNLHKHWQTACKYCPEAYKLAKPTCRLCGVVCTTKSNRNNHEKEWCPNRGVVTKKSCQKQQQQQ